MSDDDFTWGSADNPYRWEGILTHTGVHAAIDFVRFCEAHGVFVGRRTSYTGRAAFLRIENPELFKKFLLLKTADRLTR